jgi:hypothetical protein
MYARRQRRVQSTGTNVQLKPAETISLNSDDIPVCAPCSSSVIAARAAGLHPDPSRTRKLSPSTWCAVLRYESSREPHQAAITFLSFFSAVFRLTMDPLVYYRCDDASQNHPLHGTFPCSVDVRSHSPRCGRRGAGGVIERATCTGESPLHERSANETPSLIFRRDASPMDGSSALP